MSFRSEMLSRLKVSPSLTNPSEDCDTLMALTKFERIPETPISNILFSSFSSLKNVEQIIDTPIDEMTVRPLVLILGFFFTIGHYLPSRGQGYRDSERGISMEEDGYDVYSLDDKHNESDFKSKNKNKNKHCTTNFNCPERMIRAMRKLWGSISFTYIILDYFFSPVRL